MIVYRIDFLDNEGRISSSGTVHGRNDQAALRAAARMIGDHQALEIWDQTRVVGQVTSEECWRLKHRSVRTKRVLAPQWSDALQRCEADSGNLEPE